MISSFLHNRTVLQQYIHTYFHRLSIDFSPNMLNELSKRSALIRATLCTHYCFLS